MIDSIRYKYIDPKIQKNKELLIYKKTINKTNLKDKFDEEVYSSRKIKFHKYETMKESMINTLSSREKRSNSTQYILPPITLNKKEDNFIITSGMIGAKKLNNYKINKIK